MSATRQRPTLLNVKNPGDAQTTQLDIIQEEVREIARVLLTEHPPGTPMSEVWEEALTLHAVRYETEILPPQRGREDQKGTPQPRW